MGTVVTMRAQLECLVSHMSLRRPEPIYLEMVQSSSPAMESQDSHSLLQEMIENFQPDFSAEGRSKFSFPNARYSISHCDGLCLVAFQPSGRGIGIDLEKIRMVDHKVTHFFLTPAEMQKFGVMDLSSEDILYLWTLKEAAFKADLNNKGRRLLDFEIESFDKDCCDSRVTSSYDDKDYEIFTTFNEEHIVSLALATEPDLTMTADGGI